MSCAQLVTPNLDPYIHQPNGNGGTYILTDWYGWCLAYVQNAFGTGWAGSNAWEAWNDHVNIKHLDRDIPSGMYVPIWFSGYHGLGHVAIYKDGKVWSSPWHHKPYADVISSIAEVERIYGVSYVGWSEDISGKQVVEYTVDQVPAPSPPPPIPSPAPLPPSPPLPTPVIAPPVTAPSREVYPIKVTIPKYASMTDALNKTNSTGVLQASPTNYYAFNTLNGMVSITTQPGLSQGIWINPAENMVQPPVPVKVETSADVMKSWKWGYATHEPAEYKIVRDFTVKDMIHNGHDIQIKAGHTIDIYGSFVKDGTTYLRPLTSVDDKGLYYWYGIPTSNIHTGEPYLENEFDVVDQVQERWESFYDKIFNTIEGIFHPKKRK